MTDINNPQKLSRKDFEDYEFIVEELARMGRMSFPEIKDHHKQHPEDNLYTLHHPKDNHLMLFTREGMKRFWQIGRRGLKSLGPEGFKYDLDNVVTELQKLFLVQLLDNPSSINDEQSHDVFVAVIAKISEAFLPSAHYVPCTLVAHTRPPQFQIGPVEFQLSEIFWKNNGDAILANLKHQSQHQSIKEFFTQQMWISSVQVGPCDSAVGADRATEAIQSSLDLFKLFVGSGRGARIGHAYRAGFPRFSSTLYSDSSGFHITQRWASGNAVVKDDWIGDVADFRPWIFGEEAISERLQSWERLTDPEQDFWML